MSLRTFFRLFTHIQMLPVLESGEETLVGGQAVMEGVMMRAPAQLLRGRAQAERRDRHRGEPLPRMSEKYPIFKLPDPARPGHARPGHDAGRQGAAVLGQLPLLDSEDRRAKSARRVPSWALMTLNLLFSLLFFIFLYKFVPLFLATPLGKVVPALHGRFAFNMIDGLIRMAIFLAFLYLISRMKDIRRVFEYHGAEHKVVFNFESGKPVNVENAQKFTTFHPRCGTSFLLVVMVISMIVYALLPVRRFRHEVAVAHRCCCR